MRQLVTALTVPGFDGFPVRPPFKGVTTLTQYEAHYPVNVAFPHKNIDQCLGEVVAERGLKQAQGGRDGEVRPRDVLLQRRPGDPVPGEERSLVPSPKVATYDLQPEMSAAGVARRGGQGMESGAYDFILVNFANPDMVGHTGVIPAAMKAVETVDGLLGEILDRVNAADGEWVALVTADHGNCGRGLSSSSCCPCWG